MEKARCRRYTFILIPQKRKYTILGRQRSSFIARLEGLIVHI